MGRGVVDAGDVVLRHGVAAVGVRERRGAVAPSVVGLGVGEPLGVKAGWIQGGARGAAFRARLPAEDSSGGQGEDERGRGEGAEYSSNYGLNLLSTPDGHRQVRCPGSRGFQ